LFSTRMNLGQCEIRLNTGAIQIMILFWHFGILLF
jgi:hypothetical protein